MKTLDFFVGIVVFAPTNLVEQPLVLQCQVRHNIQQYDIFNLTQVHRLVQQLLQLRLHGIDAFEGFLPKTFQPLLEYVEYIVDPPTKIISSISEVWNPEFSLLVCQGSRVR